MIPTNPEVKWALEWIDKFNPQNLLKATQILKSLATAKIEGRLVEAASEEEIRKIILDMAIQKYAKNEKTIHMVFDSKGMNDLAKAIITEIGGI